MASLTNLTVVVPFYNGHATIDRLLASISEEVPVIVVDDQSERSPEPWEDVTLLRLAKRGYFAGAVNKGIQSCKTDVLVLNQDVWFEGDAWQDFVAGNRDKGICGDGVFGHPAHANGYVQGTFMYLSRQAIEAVGMLDGERWPLWGSTCELQLRMCRRGFKALPAKVPGLRHEQRPAGSRFGASITQLLQEQPGKKDWFIRTPPLVTVVIPAYNHGKYLADAVNSLVGGKTSLGDWPGQTFGGFTAIVVDDASTDDTPKVMAKLANPWTGVKYVRRGHNGGTAAALNTGIQEAHGRYVMVLAADDMLEPTALAEMLAVVEADPKHAFVYSDQVLFKNGKRTTQWNMAEYDFERLLEKNHVPAGIMMPRAAWQAVGGYPEQFARGREDWAMAVALGRAGWCGRRLAKALYLYRRQGQNRSLTNSTPKHRQWFTQQMHEAFADLYRGERPMPCCGGSPRAAAPAKGKGAAPAGMPGQEGMVLLEYIGRNVGRTYWYGPVTSTRYEFSGGKRVRYVDKRDAPGMLKVMYDRQPAFRRYVAPPAPAPAPEPEPKGEAAPVLAVPIPELEPAPALASDPLLEAAMATVEAEAPKPKRRRGRPRKDVDA